ncbi:MAG: replicative DNA helicase [Verrucomicrobiota bacterium JB023]|nr:replicative DNA helicase [Verrucomicrobiota bacterium JB023]
MAEARVKNGGKKKDGDFKLQGGSAGEILAEARSLPNALEPEKSILSSMLQDPQDRIGEAREAHLGPDHFYLPAHSTLFKVLGELYDEGKPIELVALHQVLTDRGLLDSIGGPAALVELNNYAPSAAHFSHYLEIVRNKYILRQIITTANEAIGEAYGNPEDVNGFLDTVEGNMFKIKESLSTSGEIRVKDVITDVLDVFEQLLTGERGIEGIETGYPDLDGMCSGLKPGEMFIIAARPSMGKTSFMMNIVEHIAVDKMKPSLVFSCEMSAQQIVQRLLFSRARFALSALKPGFKPTKEELLRIKKAASDLSNAPLFIDDTPSLPIGDLRAKARRKKREEDIQLIAVDYLQLMRSGTKQASDSREREIAEISSGLKAIAKELKIPVVVLAQLNRGPEQRGGTPRMSDLRESGSIEQDADMIGLLFRKEYYNDPTKDDEAKQEEQEANAGLAQLILAKNRNGATGDIPLTFIKELMRFESRAWEPDEQ